LVGQEFFTAQFNLQSINHIAIKAIGAFALSPGFILHFQYDIQCIEINHIDSITNDKD